MVGQILPRLFLYGPKAKNVFHIFKGLLKKKKVCNRNHMWLAKPKIFAIWPCKKFCQSPHENINLPVEEAAKEKDNP